MMTNTQEIWASVRALHEACYDPGVYSDSEIERHFRNIEKRLMRVKEHPSINKYRVTVRTIDTFLVEAETEGQAREQAIEDVDNLCSHDFERSVVEARNLTDPVRLIAEMGVELEVLAFQNKHEVCKFCGGPRTRHAADCIIELARYYLMEREL